MKKTTLYLIIMLTIPSLLQAQYSGGNGRGEVFARLTNVALSINEVATDLSTNCILAQNYPNPFNQTTTIKFNVTKTGNVKVVVYDIMGSEIQTLVNKTLPPGMYETSFNGSSLNSGIYIYKISSGEYFETKRMTLEK